MHSNIAYRDAVSSSNNNIHNNRYLYSTFHTKKAVQCALQNELYKTVKTRRQLK